MAVGRAGLTHQIETTVPILQVLNIKSYSLSMYNRPSLELVRIQRWITDCRLILLWI